MTFASQKIKFYVGKDGTTYGASRTDQSGVRPSLVDGRTVCGEPVEYIGEWNKSQIPYAPFKSAVEQGMATLLARREVEVHQAYCEFLLKRARERRPLPLTDLKTLTPMSKQPRS